MPVLLKAFNHFLKLQRQQWLSPDQLAELRRRRLQRLVVHASRHVPYYRQMFADFGIRPEDIANLSDFQQLPILKKEDLKKSDPARFLSEGLDLKASVAVKTSGSSGRSLELIRTREEELLGNLTYPRALVANGLKPWHRQAVIVQSYKLQEKKMLLDRLRNRLKIFIRADLDVDQQIRILRAFRPHVIRGYSGSLKLLAAAIKERHITEIKPRYVFGVAELLDEETRVLVNATFGVDMVDTYGCIEAYCVAWECPALQGYHISSDTTFVEFLKGDRPAEFDQPGRIVVTPLHVFAMPLIRYDLGDIGVPLDSPCGCGRGLPLMKMIQGRADNFITLPSGTIIPPVGTFGNIFANEPEVAEYFILQEKPDLILVDIVVHGSVGSEVVQRLRSGIEALTRHEATVKIQIVDRMKRSPGGKIRRIASRVPVSL